MSDRTIDSWIRRDHPVAELLATVATRDGEPVEVVRRAWAAVLGDLTADLPLPPRPTLFARVIDELDEADALDDTVTDLPAPGPFLPADDDRWAGWWETYPPSWPPDATLTGDDVVRALRRLPLVPRVLLVLRHVAGLEPEEIQQVLGGSLEAQEEALLDAVPAYVAHLDDLLQGDDLSTSKEP
jgi:DNA-directed RNA polymerase specialized sigma24 family protein